MPRLVVAHEAPDRRDGPGQRQPDRHPAKQRVGDDRRAGDLGGRHVSETDCDAEKHRHRRLVELRQAEPVRQHHEPNDRAAPMSLVRVLWPYGGRPR